MAPSAMTPREKAIRQKLKDDFPHYASRCLKIKPKEAGLRPLILNRAQMYLHRRLEEQKAKTGRVRAIILKGRQQGCSTYVEGRLYHLVSHQKGANAYILTHQDAATTNLFNMAKTYHDNVPELVKPVAGASNAKELFFNKLDSGYKVGTAGSKGAGRSSTIQYFHGSEVAFWPNAPTHMAGALQAVPDLPGTEIILESTSNGPEGVFFEMALAASKGQGDYQLVFIPWFWQEEYRKEVDDSFELTDEEQLYKEAYKLDDEQMAWRRAKIVELNGPHDFRREYPATFEEAFKAAAVGALWTQEILDSVRVHEMPAGFTRIGVAVDPSGGSGPDNDDVGIMVGGLATNGHAYIWEDRSGKMSPEAWATRAIAAYDRHKADFILGEKNFGGDMVEEVIQAKAREMKRRVPVKLVHASRGKQARAEPVLQQYESGLVHHVGRLTMLEDEMTTWVPGVSKKSPNRVDAAVWLVHELLLSAGRIGTGEAKTEDF